MKKTTIYLPEDLKASLERVASEEGRSEADVIREAIAYVVSSRKPPTPRLPITRKGLGDPTIAERTEELLDGYGGS